VLGIGGGKAAHTIDNLLPQAKVDLVDVDEAMIYAAQSWYCAPRRRNLSYIAADAYAFVKESTEEYDWILVDLFKGADIPAKFLTVTFFQELKRRLRLVGEGGLVGMNVIPTQLLETEALLDKAIAVFGEEQCTAEYIAGPSGTYEDGNALLLCSATSSK
jgi:spermidine synthase